MDALLTIFLDLLDVLFGAMLGDLVQYLAGRVLLPAAVLGLGATGLAGLVWLSLA